MLDNGNLSERGFFMKNIAILIVFVMMFSLGVPAYASDTSVIASYDSLTEKITISGNANGATTIVVRKEDVAASALSDANLPVDADQINSNGTYTHYFYLPQGTAYGKYYITVSNAFGSDEDSIIYYNKSVADAILKDNITNSNFVHDVKNNAAALGIDTTLPSYSDETLTLMSKIYTSYEDSADFNDKYNYCVALCSLKNKDSQGVEEVLKKYESILEIDYDNDYANNEKLSAHDKNILCALLSEMNYASIYRDALDITGETKPFVAVLKSFGAISVIKSAQSWEALKRAYTEDFDFLNKNVVGKNSAYKKLSSDDVFIALKKLSFYEIKDLKNNFDNACAAASEKNNGANTPSKGGSGSSSTRVPSGFGTGYDELPSQTGGMSQGTNVTSPAIAFVPSLGDIGAVSFPDVSYEDWFASAVMNLASSGIINGDTNGNFRPYDSITRAEFAKIVAVAFSFSGGAAKEFSDVSEDSWYASYVQRASAAGIINGYDGYFSPDDNILKQDVAVMLYRVSKMLAVEYPGIKKPFDYADASTYAWTAIGAFCENGIIKGDSDGNFKPLSPITRAEASQLVYAFINDLNTKLN